jgi:anti-anti-sigma factor
MHHLAYGGSAVFTLLISGRRQSMDPRHLSPKVERSDNVTIITFSGSQIRDVENMISTELEGNTDGLEDCHLLLDFTNVECLSSVELGTLIGLHKRMRDCGGRLTLFNMCPHVYEVFTITRLETLLGICR